MPSAELTLIISLPQRQALSSNLEDEGPLLERAIEHFGKRRALPENVNLDRELHPIVTDQFHILFDITVFAPLGTRGEPAASIFLNVRRLLFVFFIIVFGEEKLLIVVFDLLWVLLQLFFCHFVEFKLSNQFLTIK